MRIITSTCPKCGTVVAANELETRRVMKCPGLDCKYVLRFDDLDEAQRDYILENTEEFRLQDTS